MKQSRAIKWLRGLAHFWKDLLLLVLGIYLALWMENEVQSWQETDKQIDYMHRFNADLASDEEQIQYLLEKLNIKIANLEEGVQFLQTENLSIEDEEVIAKATKIGNSVSAYHFFTPQDYTFLSMRESGDFRLLKDDGIKTQLLKLNNRYQVIELLQLNYMQGLDTEFIPLWVRNVDMINNKIVNPEMVNNLIFKNMIGFAWNETQQRRAFLSTTLQQIKTLRAKLTEKIESD